MNKYTNSIINSNTKNINSEQEMHYSHNNNSFQHQEDPKLSKLRKDNL